MIRPTLLYLLLCLAACTSPGAGECPVDLNKLAPIVTELHLAEGLAIEIPIQVRDSIKEQYYSKVLEDHQLSRAAFDSLMWIVRQEPVWVDSLYTQVGVELARLEAGM